MEDIRDELLDAYAQEAEIAECSFGMMGKLLDKEYVKERIRLLNENRIYIYGGGYLGIQTYQACSKLINIPAVVDKKGKLVLNISNIPVINFDDFKQIYNGEKVIIASVRFYQEIYNDISSFVPKIQRIFLGEFLGGLVQ